MVDFRDRVDTVLTKCMKNFGEEMLFLPKSGGRYKFEGIFDNEYQSIDTDTEQVTSSNQPAVGVNLHKFGRDPLVGDQLQLRNLTYNIIDVREDGQGGATLFLHKADHGKKVRKKKD